MPRIAAIADVHLGHRKSPGISWVQNSFNRSDADILIIAGDLFDRQHSTEEHVEEAFNLLEQQSRPVLMIWGNHDVAGGFHEIFPDIPGVHIPPGFDVENVELQGVTFHAINVATDPDPRLVNFPRAEGPGHVGIYHTSMDGQRSKKPCLPASVETLLDSNYEAWILGHVHAPTKLLSQPLIEWVGQGGLVEVDIQVS